MSCWIVTTGHVDAIVQALVTEQIIPAEEATATGKLLIAANNKSFSFNYEGRYDHELNDVDSYRFRGVEAPLRPWGVYKQARCYDYQSCDAPDWEQSQAFRLVRTLREILELRLDVGPLDAVGKHWNSEPWGIDSIEELVA